MDQVKGDIDMNWENMTEEQQQKIRDLYCSPQYKKSNDLLGARIEKNISREKAAEYLNINMNDYVLLESGNISVQVEDYEKIIQKILNYDSELLIESEDHSLRKYSITYFSKIEKSDFIEASEEMIEENGGNHLFNIIKNHKLNRFPNLNEEKQHDSINVSQYSFCS